MVREIERIVSGLDSAGHKAGSKALHDFALELQAEGKIPPTLREPIFLHSAYEHNRDQGLISSSGKQIAVGPTTSQVLTSLETDINNIVSNEEIEDAVWGSYRRTHFKSSSSVKSHIAFLRAAFKNLGLDPKLIQTIWTRGYLLIDSARQSEQTTEVSSNTEQVYTHPGFTYYPQRLEVHVKGVSKNLTPSENDILSKLSRNPNRVLSRVSLLDAMTGIGEDDYDFRLVDVHISHLRRKLEPEGRESGYQYLVTRRDSGYMLVDPSRGIL